MAGASVVATANGRSVSFSATTDENGEFSLTVAPDAYTVRITANGFTEATQTVSLSQTGSASLDVILQLSGVASSVTVRRDGRLPDGCDQQRHENVDAVTRHSAINHRRH